MIWRQSLSRYLRSSSMRRLRQQVAIQAAIFHLEECYLAVVATLRDVMRHAGINESGGAINELRVVRGQDSVIYQRSPGYFENSNRNSHLIRNIYGRLLCYYTIFFAVSLSICVPRLSFAEVPKEAKFESICGLNDILLFSCKAESGKLISLCLSKAALTTKILTVEKDGAVDNIYPKVLNQVSSGSSSGASTIIMADADAEKVYFYVDGNVAEPSPDVMTFIRDGLKTNEFCLPSTAEIPVTEWHGPHNNWPGSVFIFSLQLLKITSPFNSGEAPELDLWRSWPIKSH